MLPSLGLTELVKQAAEPASPQAEPIAEESQERAAKPKKTRAPKARTAKDRSGTLPVTIWLKPSTWQRARLLACRRGVSASEIVEGALLATLPDLVVSERGAA